MVYIRNEDHFFHRRSDQVFFRALRLNRKGEVIIGLGDGLEQKHLRNFVLTRDETTGILRWAQHDATRSRCVAFFETLSHMGRKIKRGHIDIVSF